LIAVTGRADALVTGDTADVLFLQKIGQVRIMTARALLDLLEPPQKPRVRKR
jgi:predicted nucleic acid-binding protein